MSLLALTISHTDLAIIIAYMCGVVAFGAWIGRRQTSIGQYLLGGRDLPWWAVLFSIVATETSTATFLSVPGLAFKPEGGNFTFLQLAIGYVIGRYVVVYMLLPHYFRGELFTAYQVLDRRFGGATKQTASLLFLITRNLADGLRLYLAALVLSIVIDVPLWQAVVVMGVATIAYTFVGGMKAVVWNDCIQFVVYIVGALVAFGMIVGKLPGGWTQLADYAQTHEKWTLWDLRLDFTQPYTLYAGVIGGAFFALGTHGTDQLMVQRYLSARNLSDASRALKLSGWVVLAQFALFLLLGVGLACFYDQFQPNATFDKGDRVFAQFIVDYLPVGVVGFTLAAVFSAAMSTLSSSLNSSATAAINDFYRPLVARHASETHLLWASRLATVIFGLIQIGVGLAGSELAESVVVSVLAIAGFTTGVILGVFLLGIWPWGRIGQPAALVAFCAGLVGMSTIAFATPLAWPWFVAVGSVMTLVFGIMANSVLRRLPRNRQEKDSA